MADQVGLEKAKEDLQIEIRKSFEKIYSLSLGANTNNKKVDPYTFLDILSKDLSSAIHKYTTSARVDIQEIEITVNQPIPVSVAAGGVGGTTAVGKTTKKGVGVLQ